jgi:hypothetical protein
MVYAAQGFFTAHARPVRGHPDHLDALSEPAPVPTKPPALATVRKVLDEAG